MRRLLAVGLGAAFVLVLLAPAAAYAADPPPNDVFAAVTWDTPTPDAATSPPYAQTVDISGASVDPDEPPAPPTGTCNPGRTKSVWYRFVAPGTGVVVVGASDYFSDLKLVTYRYDAAIGGFAGLTRVGCRGATTLTTGPITSTVPIVSGVTYYTQVSDNGSGGGSVSLTFRFYPPPSNDMFGSATTVPTFPWNSSAELWAAGVGAGERKVCGPRARPSHRVGPSGTRSSPRDRNGGRDVHRRHDRRAVRRHSRGCLPPARHRVHRPVVPRV